MKRIHFIAIGGSAMHNLAIAIHLKNYQVSGSDDEIFDPAKSRLQKYALLPPKEGWFPEKIDSNLDAVIVGMHAKEDNPELLKAKELGIKIFSYPEYLYEQSKNKKRVVIGGSHGKTSITAMILHVMQKLGKACDYMVGAQLEGFEVMVKLTEDAPVIILEGDEYLTSPIDRRPKFHVYQADLGVINGIAWDHINVFPSFENYVEQFSIFADTIQEPGCLLYYQNDEEIRKIGEKTALRKNIQAIPYTYLEHEIKDGKTYAIFDGKTYELQIFGKHNLQNLAAALGVCKNLGVETIDFMEAIQSFKGASRRLELVYSSDKGAMYKDFAHSPSKLRATVNAMKEQYPFFTLTACMELHTFSSLRQDFLKQYHGAMEGADKAIVYFNPHAIAHKKLEPISKEMIVEAFGRADLLVFNQSEQLLEYLMTQDWENTSLLWMSSGNFDGIEEKKLAEKIFS